MLKWLDQSQKKASAITSRLTFKSTTTTSSFNGSLINTFQQYGKPILKSSILTLVICVLSFLPMAFSMPSSVGSVQVDGYSVNQIVNAIYRIEGGSKAVKPFGILSVPCNSYQECRRICENTVINNIVRWHKSGARQTYLEFLASRYAPAEAHPLNKNWLPNLKSVLRGV